jgi:hypothetical protein
MSDTNNITIEQNDKQTYHYLVTVDPANMVSNFMIRVSKDNILEVNLTILGAPIIDATIGDYVGERSVTYFNGRQFLNNNETTWTYLESFIASGIAPADWVTYFNPNFGGQYNFTEVSAFSNANVASEILLKYQGLTPFLLNNNPRNDYAPSIV